MVDLIGQYKIRTDVTMIDPETGWFEIIQYNDKQSDTRANLVEQTWLCIYPKPTIITYNRGNEFLGRAFKNDPIENEYVIKSECATIENPQQNSIPERIHQFVLNLVRTFDLQKRIPIQ